jgi:hypothetical protein
MNVPDQLVAQIEDQPKESTTMTRREASEQARHYGCGGQLRVGQKPGKSKTMWYVQVRCEKCGKRVLSIGPYRRLLEGEAAKQDRAWRAVVEFNQGAPWEQED